MSYPLRSFRGLSLEAFSQMSGVSRSMINNIETGKTSPTLQVLEKLAMAMPLGELVDPKTQSYKYVLTSTKDCDGLVSKDKSYSCVLLSHASPNPYLKIHQFQFGKRGQHESPGHGPRSREYIIVQKGEMILEVGEEEIAICAGEILDFRSDGTHTYKQQTTDNLASGINLLFFGP